MNRNLFLLYLLFFFASCNKRLHKVIVKNAEIEVTKYEISEITAVHDFIEVRKGNSVVTALEASSYGFADIIIKQDTIIIQYLPSVFYELKAEAFNYVIKLDTTITAEYWRQKNTSRDKVQQ